MTQSTQRNLYFLDEFCFLCVSSAASALRNL